MLVEIEVFDHDPRQWLHILEATTRIDVDYLRQYGSRVPRLMSSGVRWRQEPGRERFLAIPTILRQHHGDCDDLAPWKAAELRVYGTDALVDGEFGYRAVDAEGFALEVDARCLIVQQDEAGRLFHVLVEYAIPAWDPGQFYKSDPSVMLGMTGWIHPSVEK